MGHRLTRLVWCLLSSRCPPGHPSVSRPRREIQMLSAAPGRPWGTSCPPFPPHLRVLPAGAPGGQATVLTCCRPRVLAGPPPVCLPCAWILLQGSPLVQVEQLGLHEPHTGVGALGCSGPGEALEQWPDLRSPSFLQCSLGSARDTHGLVGGQGSGPLVTHGSVWAGGRLRLSELLRHLRPPRPTLPGAAPSSSGARAPPCVSASGGCVRSAPLRVLGRDRGRPPTPAFLPLPRSRTETATMRGTGGGPAGTCSRFP